MSLKKDTTLKGRYFWNNNNINNNHIITTTKTTPRIMKALHVWAQRTSQALQLATVFWQSLIIIYATYRTTWVRLSPLTQLELSDYLRKMTDVSAQCHRQSIGLLNYTVSIAEFFLPSAACGCKKLTGKQARDVKVCTRFFTLAATGQRWLHLFVFPF